MTTQVESVVFPAAVPAVGGQAAADQSQAFDWAMTVVAGWILGGAYLDGWAHSHGRVDTSFFTPYHAALYSGLLATALVSTVAFVRGRLSGQGWRTALPAGYGLTLAGAAVFALGGVADLVWHTVFGIEKDIEAIFSPSHLLLAFAITLISAGPLRAAWSRAGTRARWSEHAPMILSLTLTISLFSFFTMFVQPLARLWASGSPRLDPEAATALGMSGILLQSAMLMGAVLFVLRRWSLPPGTLTFVFTVNAALIGFLADDYPLAHVVGVAGASLLADLLLWRLDPSPTRRGALRLFAFLVPVLYFASYFIAVEFTEGVWWSVHLWTGALVLAGVVGLFLSYLTAPPVSPGGSPAR